MSIAFIICTEPGRLEKQSLLLAESIRKYGGNLKDVPIYSYHPRKGEGILNTTQESFEKLNVCHQQVVLNEKYYDYYLANKPYVCAYAEEQIDTDILVFLDSDKCLFAEPKELLLGESFNVGLRPEYGKGIGSTGIKDTQDEYWKKLYQLCGVNQEIFVTTPIGNKQIRAYWNSGMVAVRRKAGIFTAWKHNLIKAMEHQLQPSQGIYMVEQSTLSATICSQENPETIFTFPPSYSYPLPLHNRLSKENKVRDFEEIISAHYFNMFYYNNWQGKLKGLKKLNKESEKYDWLCHKVAEYEMPFKHISHDYLLQLRRVEKKLSGVLKVKITLSDFILNKWLS